MGSFAETLLLRSPVPVLVVSPRWKRVERFETILFATDFSQQSRDAFPAVVKLAKALGCELTVFHKVAPLSVVAPGLYHEPRAKLGVRLERRFLLAQQWAERARSEGVPASVALDYRSRRSTEQSILDRVAGKAALIAMASHSGPVARILTGSTTRKVVRRATCPVWVVHPVPRAARGGPEKLDFLHLSEQDILDDLQYHGRRRRAA
jgi:nucleotide-binding universal stress UspA family protein